MPFELLHIFRNTPFGRETLMQSAFFCQQMGMPIVIYIPRESQFLMYFEHGVVTVDLDRSYLRSPESARDHAREIVERFEVRHRLFEPTAFTAGLPDVRSDYAFMSCPRSISDLSTKIGLGYIGSRVRAIVKQAPFPVLVPAVSFKKWDRIVSFFGGSTNAMIALRFAREISRRSKARLTIFTQLEGERDAYEQQLEREGLAEDLAERRVEWLCFEESDLRANLYAVHSDALVLAGAHGHGVAKDLVFGSKLELIQSELPNPMVIVGPNAVLWQSATPTC
jgi:nucleotide-binding universal stress UspA family protein